MDINTVSVFWVNENCDVRQSSAVCSAFFHPAVPVGLKDVLSLFPDAFLMVTNRGTSANGLTDRPSEMWHYSSYIICSQAEPTDTTMLDCKRAVKEYVKLQKRRSFKEVRYTGCATMNFSFIYSTKRHVMFVYSVLLFLVSALNTAHIFLLSLTHLDIYPALLSSLSSGVF